MSLEKCKTGFHSFDSIYSSGNEMEELVVRWCRDCGCIRIDTDCDGRIHAQDIMQTKFPTIAKNLKNYN